MEKNSVNTRYAYDKTIYIYNSLIEKMNSEERETLKAINEGDEEPAFLRLRLAEQMLNMASVYMVIDGVSRSVLNMRNENMLNDARKSVNKSITYLEGVVSNNIDAPFSAYEDLIDKISAFSPAGRYLLMQKTGLTIHLLKNAYGDNSKWKWTFVETEGRFAATAKNIINLSELTANRDPRSPHYEPTIFHLRLVKKLLMQASDRYRERYELSTGRIDDFKMGIVFLSALKRFNIIIGDQPDVNIIQKKLDVWNNKLTADAAKQKLMQGKKGQGGG